jgi:hypothetical protein
MQWRDDTTLSSCGLRLLHARSTACCASTDVACRSRTRPEGHPDCSHSTENSPTRREIWISEQGSGVPCPPIYARARVNVNLELSRSGKPCQERISATGWAPESWADSPNKWDSASSGRDTSRPVAASMAGSVRTTDNCQCRVQRAVRRDLDPPAVLPTLSMCPDHPTFALWLFGITGAAVTHIENPLIKDP